MQREKEIAWLNQREQLLRSDLELIRIRREELETEQEEAAELEGLPDMRPISQVCAELKLSRDFVMGLCKKGLVPHVTVGNKTLINFGQLTKYLNKAGKAGA